jgi:hypothetical protein
MTAFYLNAALVDVAILPVDKTQIFSAMGGEIQVPPSHAVMFRAEMQ